MFSLQSQRSRSLSVVSYGRVQFFINRVVACFCMFSVVRSEQNKNVFFVFVFCYC